MRNSFSEAAAKTRQGPPPAGKTEGQAIRILDNEAGVGSFVDENEVVAERPAPLALEALNEDIPPFDPATDCGPTGLSEDQLAKLGPGALQSLERIPSEGSGTAMQWAGEILQTHDALEAMPKRRILIPQASPGRKQLPKVQVQINDYNYWIPRGVIVAVPLEVARIVYESGAMNFPG